MKRTFSNTDDPQILKKSRFEDEVACQFCFAKLSLECYTEHIMVCEDLKILKIIRKTDVQCKTVKILLEKLNDDSIEKINASLKKQRVVQERRNKEKDDKMRLEAKSKDLVIKILCTKSVCTNDETVQFRGPEKVALPVRTSIRNEQSTSKYQKLALTMRYSFLKENVHAEVNQQPTLTVENQVPVVGTHKQNISTNDKVTPRQLETLISVQPQISTDIAPKILRKDEGSTAIRIMNDVYNNAVNHTFQLPNGTNGPNITINYSAPTHTNNYMAVVSAAKRQPPVIVPCLHPSTSLSDPTSNAIDLNVNPTMQRPVVNQPDVGLKISSVESLANQPPRFYQSIEARIREYLHQPLMSSEYQPQVTQHTSKAPDINNSILRQTLFSGPSSSNWPPIDSSRNISRPLENYAPCPTISPSLQSTTNEIPVNQLQVPYPSNSPNTTNILRIKSVNELNRISQNNFSNGNEIPPLLPMNVQMLNPPVQVLHNGGPPIAQPANFAPSHKIKVRRYHQYHNHLQVFLENLEDMVDIQELNGEGKLQVRKYLSKPTFIYGLQETCLKEKLKDPSETFPLLKQQILTIFDGAPPDNYNFLFEY